MGLEGLGQGAGAGLTRQDEDDKSDDGPPSTDVVDLETDCFYRHLDVVKVRPSAGQVQPGKVVIVVGRCCWSWSARGWSFWKKNRKMDGSELLDGRLPASWLMEICKNCWVQLRFKSPAADFQSHRRRRAVNL